MPVSAPGQQGQALVGVMVVMLILFALAGAVAIGASTLLAGRGQSRLTNDDFQVRSAVNDSVAQIAGNARICGAPPPLPSPSPTPAPTPTPSPLSLSLPPRVSAQAYCMRQDWVEPGSLQRHAPQSNCDTLPLGQPNGRVAVLFDARATSGGWAYLDTRPASTCSTPFPTPSPSDLPCRESFGATQLVQVALTCDYASGDSAFLHIDVSGPGPRQVFTALENPQGAPGAVGFLYLIAAGTGVASPDYEESVYYVSDDGATRRLLYEAPLP
ncbi:MAG TPA: hypothetical protein VLW53_06285 [Candidatus Eisenbacteria bacterium]|nr:hypothetical protein [Candidatus Eisenbacteria bacterium]